MLGLVVALTVTRRMNVSLATAHSMTMTRPVVRSSDIACRFCGSREVLVGFRDGFSDVYVPACGVCAVDNIGDYLEVVDALAIWPRKKGENHA